MTILDANILLYAYDGRAAEHARVRSWLEDLFQEREAIGLPWVSLWAFLRISTNPRITHEPLTLEEAFEVVDEIRKMPRSILIEPEGRHAEILREVAARGQASGPRMTDAVLAALAIENGARLASTDRDFSRFPGLNWVNPLV